jgi:hypothetical protein
MCLILFKPAGGLGAEGVEGEEFIPPEHPPKRVATTKEITRIVRTSEHTFRRLEFPSLIIRDVGRWLPGCMELSIDYSIP